MKLWVKAKIPILEQTMIRKRVQKVLTDHAKVIKSPNSYNANKWNELFLISRCKCGIENGISCSCDTEDKIPLETIDFYKDQCSTRLLTLEVNEEDEADDMGGDVGAVGGDVAFDVVGGDSSSVQVKVRETVKWKKSLT